MGFPFYLVIAVFILCYFFIAIEHIIRINKTATALILCTILWSIVALCGASALAPDVWAGMTDDIHGNIKGEILKLLGDTAEIVFFLLGAMTIVEIVDSYGGFRIITDRIRTRSKTKLLWTLGIITFFMSSVLDNLTTTIVILALLRKLITGQKDRWFFAAVTVIAANAGGAWTPIGDVTTIMLWIAGKVGTAEIIKTTFLASLASVIVPFAILTFMLKGDIKGNGNGIKQETLFLPAKIRNLMFFIGVGLLLCVPVFKTITHLPPYIGMLGALGILWTVTEIITDRMKDKYDCRHLHVTSILSHVDMTSVLFFLGILMAVSCLNYCGHLTMLAEGLDTIPLTEPQKYYLIDVIIGILSSIVDNVPLVAGVIKMYAFPENHYFWTMLAYCAGTGGSILIIGSAAGVAAMGIEKINFIWYLKNMSWIALIGYLAGAGVYIFQKIAM